MSEALPTSAPQLDLTQQQQLKSRALIIDRLIDVVGWPSTRVPANERQMAGDVLVDLLRRAPAAVRARCAQRLANLQDAPKPLLRFLARDDIAIAAPLLREGGGFDDADLIATIRASLPPHWLAIAQRRVVPAQVADMLIRCGHPEVTEAVLRNAGSLISSEGVDSALMQAKAKPGIGTALLHREELKPAQGLMLFWWVGPEQRQHVLRRFALDRAVLIDHLGDLFAQAAKEGWADPDSRKALQLIERRQRNRAAIIKSPLGSLEAACVQAERGLDPSLADDIAYMSGIRPTTFRHILADPGGEPLAIAIKSTGLKRTHLAMVWRGLKRPQPDSAPLTSPWGRTLQTFETLPTAKAQTVLRYWNWVFTSQGSAQSLEMLARGLDLSDDDADLAFNPALRNALMLLSPQ